MPRAQSLKRNNSAIYSLSRPSDLSPSKIRNISTLLPRHESIVISTASPLQQFTVNKSEVNTPLMKSNRLSSGLKIIR